jgi:hypothetical protein
MPSFGAQDEPFDLTGLSRRQRSVHSQAAALLLLVVLTILACAGAAWASGQHSVAAVFAVVFLLLVAMGCTIGVTVYAMKLSARALRALVCWLAARRSVQAILAAARTAGEATASGDASADERSPAGEFAPLDWKRMWW